MAAIWADVLRLERVGVEADFFALGGHSLLATQVVARVRDAFGVELPLRALFEAPTVAGLAARVGAARAAGAAGEAPPASSPPPVLPAPRDGATIPLSFAQQRLWFLDQLAPGTAIYAIPAALRLTGPLDVAALEGALNAVVARHEALRTTFAAAEGRPEQVVAPALAVPLPVADLSALPPAAREAAVVARAQAEAGAPFDLAAGPLLRAALLRLGPAEHVLLLTLHHVVADGWSMDVLLRELSGAYGAISRGEAPALPALPVQYGDYAAWQRGWLQGEVLEGQLAYWREALAGLPEALDLPTDHPYPAQQTFDGGRESIDLPADLMARLMAAGRREGATPYMVLPRRLPGPAGALQRADRPGRGDARGGAPAPGAGGADRVLRQHPRAAGRPLRQPHGAGAPGPGAGGLPGGPGPPGRPLREAWWTSCGPSATSAATPCSRRCSSTSRPPPSPSPSRGWRRRPSTRRPAWPAST